MIGMRGMAKSAHGGRGIGFAFIGILLLLWELSARTGLVHSENWPPVSLVFAAVLRETIQGDLLKMLGGTLYRMLIGLLAGSALGIVTGILMARIPWLRLALSPSVEMLRPLPVPALIPPLILFLGLDDAMKITLVAMTAFFPVLINTMKGALSVEPTYQAVAATFHVPRMARLWKVAFPAALPFIFAGVRISIGLAFVVAVVGEMIAGASGIGYYLVSMQYAGRPADMYGALLLLAACGYLINRCFMRLERRVLAWHAREAG